MRYLITGGGFIGSHLCDELLARGHRVHVLDDLSTGSMDNIRVGSRAAGDPDTRAAPLGGGVNSAATRAPPRPSGRGQAWW